MDITQLILDDHHEQRRLFAMLEQVDRADVDSLGVIWRRLATFLEVHAEAEERHFYLALLRVGTGAGGKASASAETKDAIKDHNEIRDAAKAVDACEVGSEQCCLRGRYDFKELQTTWLEPYCAALGSECSCDDTPVPVPDAGLDAAVPDSGPEDDAG